MKITKTANIPTYTQKIQTLAGNKASVNKTAKDAKNKILALKKEKSLKGQGDRADFLSAIIDKMFVLPIDTARKLTNLEFKFLADEYANDFSGLSTNLATETENFKTYTDQIVKTTEGYLNKITEGSPKGKITKEFLIKMSKSKIKAKNFVKILLGKNKDLKTALQGALGTLNPEPKEKSFQNLEKYFNKYPNTKNETIELAFVILTLMSSKDRNEFTEKYLEKRNSEDQIAFLEYGNLMGAFSPKDMEKFHPQGKNISKKKENEYSEAYKAQNDFYKKSKKLLTSSYGGKNAASEMMTGQNLLILVAQIAAGGTIAANLMASIFRDGSIQKPSEIVKSVLKNEYILGASAVLGGIHILKQPETLSDTLTGSAERTTMEEKEARSIIKKTTSSNVGLSTFLEGGGSDFRGAEAFGDYVLSLGDDFDAKKVSISGFLKWMNVKSKESDTKKVEYKDLIGKISKKDEKYEFSGAKTENYEIQKLAKAFFILGIGGEEARHSYPSIINQKGITPAKAKVKKPSPKTKRANSRTTKKTT